MENRLKFKIFQNDNHIDLTLFQFGWERCAPLHSYGPAMRNHYLFHYVFSGRGTLDSTDSAGNTSQYQIEAGKGFLICPKQVNTYHADERHPWEYAWIEFDGIKAADYLRMAGLDFDHPIYQLKNRDGAVSIRNEMMYIIDNPDNSVISQIGHLYLFFDRLVANSANRKENRPGSLRDFYIKEAVSFIEQNYHFPITVESVAAFCGLNRNYLSKLFRESLNQTLQQFLMSYRMNKAADLLSSTEMSVAEVGCRCGYQNQLHFSRAFKSVVGASPSQWRTEHSLRSVGTPPEK